MNEAAGSMHMLPAEPEVCRLLTWNPIVGASRGFSHELRASSAHLRMIDEPEQRQFVLEIGPVDLPAHSTHHQIVQIPTQIGYIPFDMAVNGFDAEVVDEDGNPVPRQVLHHIDTTRPAYRELFLPVAQRFAAAGTETKRGEVPPWLSGIGLHEGEPLLVTAMFHNPTGTSYHGVRARLILIYTKMSPLYDIYPFHLDVMFPTGDKSFDLPPGRSVRTWEGSPAISGGVVLLTGHLHDYSETLSFTDITTGKVIWKIHPYLEKDGRIKGVPLDFSPRSFAYPIKASHRYRITSVYNNPTGHTLKEGGMAKVIGVFVPSHGARWPAANRGDPLYRTDLAHILRGCPGQKRENREALREHGQRSSVEHEDVPPETRLIARGVRDSG